MTKAKRKVDLFSLFYKNSLLVEAIIIFGLFQIFTGGMFLTVRNLSNLLMQGATCSIISVTMCLVIITGNADLSAGRYLGMLAMVAALIQVNYGSIPSIVVVLRRNDEGVRRSAGLYHHPGDAACIFGRQSVHKRRTHGRPCRGDHCGDGQRVHAVNQRDKQ